MSERHDAAYYTTIALLKCLVEKDVFNPADLESIQDIALGEVPLTKAHSAPTKALIKKVFPSLIRDAEKIQT